MTETRTRILGTPMTEAQKRHLIRGLTRVWMVHELLEMSALYRELNRRGYEWTDERRQKFSWGAWKATDTIALCLAPSPAPALPPDIRDELQELMNTLYQIFDYQFDCIRYVNDCYRTCASHFPDDDEEDL